MEGLGVLPSFLCFPVKATWMIPFWSQSKSHPLSWLKLRMQPFTKPLRGNKTEDLKPQDCWGNLIELVTCPRSQRKWIEVLELEAAQPCHILSQSPNGERKDIQGSVQPIPTTDEQQEIRRAGALRSFQVSPCLAGAAQVQMFANTARPLCWPGGGWQPLSIVMLSSSCKRNLCCLFLRARSLWFWRRDAFPDFDLSQIRSLHTLKRTLFILKALSWLSLLLTCGAALPPSAHSSSKTGP